MPDVVSHLRDAGFNDQEITSWSTDKRSQLAAGGFSDAEIDDYFGMPKTPEQIPPALVDRAIKGLDISQQITGLPAAVADIPHEALKTTVDSLRGVINDLLPKSLGGGREPGTESTFEGLGKTGEGLLGLAGLPFAPLQGALRSLIGHPIVATDEALRRGAVSIHGEDAVAAAEKATGNDPGGMTYEEAKRKVDTAMMMVGARGMSRVGVGPMGEPELVPVGGLPKGEDFSTAGTVIGNGDTTPAMEKKLADLYEEKGIHPAEVAHDAQTDPTITQSILSTDEKDMPGAYGPPPKPPEPPAPPAGEPPPYSDAEKKILSKISIGEESPKSKLTWNDLYTNFIDKLFPISKAVKDVGAELSAEDNPYQRARLLSGYVGKADHFLNNGTFDFTTYENNGPSLKEILRPVGDLNGFRAYATASRALELEGRGIKSGFAEGEPSAPPLVSSGLDAARTVVKDGAEKYEKPFRALVDYQNRVSQYLRDSGVLSDASYKAMVEANKMYVPFSRVMGIDADAPHVGGSTLQAHNPIRAIKGSARDIIDPIESVVRNTYHFVEMAEKNVVGTKLVDMLKRGQEELPDKPVEGAPGLRLVAAPEGGVYEAKQIKGDEKYFKAVDKDGNVTAEILVSIEGKTARIEDILNPAAPRTAGQNAIGPAQLRSLLRQFREQHPEIEELTGKRVSGARAGGGYKLDEGAEVSVKLPAAVEQEAVKDAPHAAAVADALAETGIKNSNDLAASLAHASAPVREGEIAILRNGKRETYTVDADLARAMKGLDAQSMGILEKLLSYPASLLRAGAVTTPDFAIRHTIRDFLYATTTFKGGVFSPADMAKGFAGLIMKDEDYWNWLKGGGGNISLVGIDRRYMQEDLRKLTGQTGLVGRAWNVIADPDASMWEKTGAAAKLPFQAISKFVLDPLRLVTQFAENASHLAAFKKTMRVQERAGGDDLRSQIIQSAWASRDTAVDAARMGANMRAYNMITAFANIKLQDTDRVVRAIKDNPIGTLTKIGGAITVPTVLLWAANHNDPRYDEIPQWQKDLFWIVMTPDHVFRIPKPWAMGQIFGSLPERLLNEFSSKNPESFKDFFKDLWATSGPDFIPSAAAPIVDQFANRSTFTNRTLIPSEQEKFLPEYQYTPYTTELTKSLGKIIGAFPGMQQLKMDNSGFGGTARALTSPILMENYIRGWSGTLGVYALNAADAALRKAGALPDPPQPAATLADIPIIKAFVIRYPSASAESIQGFYDTYATNKAYFDTWMAKAKDGDIAATQHIQEMGGPMMFVQLDGIKSVLTEHNQLIRDLYKNPDVPPDEKRQLVDQLYFSMIQVAQHGQGLFRQIKDTATVRGALMPTSGLPEGTTAP